MEKYGIDLFFFIEQSVKEEVDVCNIATCSDVALALVNILLPLPLILFVKLNKEKRLRSKVGLPVTDKNKTNHIISWRFLTEKHLA